MMYSGTRAIESLERRILFTYYTITDLGTLGGNTSAANALNDSNWVVGQADNADGIAHAFLWKNGKMTDLGALAPGYISAATAINSSGEIVGSSEDPIAGRSTQTAFSYEFGLLTNLGVLPDQVGSTAYGITDAGIIVGESGFNPAEWGESGVINLLTNGNGGVANAINKFGEAVGSETNLPAAFQAGSDTFLGGIGGAQNQDGSALAINAQGAIAGIIDVGTNGVTQNHAFYYDLGIMTDIGTLGVASKAESINNSSQAVGTFFTKGGAQHAFVWNKSQGVTLDLNKMVPPHSGWVLQDAHGINNHGRIVGQGIAPDGKEHAFLLTPHSGIYVDKTPPTATLTPIPDLTTAQDSFTITVTYRDAGWINFKTLKGANILVKNTTTGFRRSGRISSIDEKVDGARRVVIYRIIGPAGTWASADNGTYQVWLLGHQVADESGNFAHQQLLGTFDVNIM